MHASANHLSASAAPLSGRRVGGLSRFPGRRIGLLLVLLSLGTGLLGTAGCASSGRSLALVAGSAVVYPPEARAAGTEGYVVVRYDVDAAGTVRNARVVEAQPAGVFDAAALETVSSWRFRPARKGTQPEVIEGVQSRVQFSLDAGAAYRDY